MVETRSGRHVSPIPSTTNTSRSGSRKRSKRKDLSPAPVEDLFDRNEESNSGLLAGHASTPEVIPHTLPDRSKGSSESQEPIGNSPGIPVVAEAEGSRATSVRAGTKDTDSMAVLAPTGLASANVNVVQDNNNLKPTEGVVQPDSEPSFNENNEFVEVMQQPEGERSHIEEDIDATFVTASESPIKISAERKREEDDEVVSGEELSTPKANHKQFEAERPQDIASRQQVTENQVTVAEKTASEEESFMTAHNNENQDAESSDDDAPEEITTSAGAQQAKLTAAKTAQSIQNQELAERAKRRRRDEEFKAQAQASKKRKAVSEPQPNASTSISDSLLASAILDVNDLPDELPEEILAREPVQFVDTADLDSRTTNVLNKRKRLDQDIKPAKDLRIGTTNVRVLPGTDLSLPPPAVKQAANIKEAWLKARAEESKKKMASYRVKGAGARSFLRR